MWIALKFNVLLMGRSSNEELMKELSDQRRGGGGGRVIFKNDQAIGSDGLDGWKRKCSVQGKLV